MAHQYRSNAPTFTATRGLINGVDPNRLAGSPSLITCNLATRTIMHRFLTGVKEILPNNIFSGNDQIDFEAIFRHGPSLDHLITVFVDDEECMNKSALSSVVGLAYTIKARQNLFNEVTMHISGPAPIRHADIEQNCQTTIVTQRFYSSVERAVTLAMTASAIKEIINLANQLRSPNHGFISETAYENPRMEAQAKAAAKYYLDQLTKAFGIQYGKATRSMVMALVAEAKDKIEMGSIPRSLQYVTDQYSTSISEQVKCIADADKMLRQKSTKSTLYANFARQYVEDTFALSKKEPMDVIFSLIDVGLQNGMNMIRGSEADATGVLIHHNDSTRTPMRMIGYLGVAQKVMKVIRPKCQKGRRVGKVPVYLHNDSAYQKFSNNEEYIILRPNDLMAERNFSTYDGNVKDNPLVRMVDGSNTYDKTAGAIELSQAGKKIIAGSYDKENADFPSEHLYTLNVDHPCMFIETENGATVVEEIRDKTAVAHTSSRRTANDMPIRTELMRISMGDMDHNSNKQVYNWSAKLLNKNERDVDLNSSADAFETKDVTMHTPAISSVTHQFGASQLKIVFMDPELYDATSMERSFNAIVKNAYDLRGDNNLSCITSCVQNIVELIADKINIFREYFNDASSSQERRLELCKTELHPFFDFTLTEAALHTPRVQAKFRHIYAYTPQYVVPIEEHARRGNMLVCHSIKEYEQLQDRLVNVIKALDTTNDDTLLYPGKIRKDGQEINGKIKDNLETEITSIADCVIAIMKNTFPNCSKIEFMFMQPTRDVVIRHVLLPVLIGKYLRVEKVDDGIYAMYYTKTPDWTRYVPELSENDGRYNYLMMCANTYMVATNTAQTVIHRVLTLATMLQKISPISLASAIDAKFPSGLAVDFLRKEKIYSNNIYFATPEALSMIVAPKPLETSRNNSRGDGGEKHTMSTVMQSVNNMCGPVAISMPSVYPNPSADNMASDSGTTRPVIAVDYLTTMGKGSLSDLCAIKNSSIGKEDVERLIRELRDSDREREKYRRAGKLNIARDAYVGIIRPVLLNGPNSDIMAYMGIPRHEAITTPSVNTNAFVEFYSSREQSVNPYISNLGAMYNQRFTPNDTTISSFEINRPSLTFRLTTTNIGSSNDVLCGTTRLLEEAFTLNMASMELMTDTEMNATKNWVQMRHTKDAVNNINLPYVAFHSPQTETLLNSNISVPARMGYSVPYTYYSCPICLQTARTMSGKVLSHPIKPAKFAVVSPYGA